jgi:hypothetical protein
VQRKKRFYGRMLTKQVTYESDRVLCCGWNRRYGETCRLVVWWPVLELPGPPTDEVDDLEAISFVEGCLWPPVAGNDFSIQFDGHSVGFHTHS